MNTGWAINYTNRFFSIKILRIIFACFCLKPTVQFFIEVQERLAELAKLLEFENLLKRTVGKLSGGQRRRVDIARALIHRPKILILDEPTTGLDPQTRNILWKVVGDLRKNEGRTVFLTTHYMEEAADADYVVILDSGKIVAEGTPLTLKNTYTGDFITIYGIQESQIKEIGNWISNNGKEVLGKVKE